MVHVVICDDSPSAAKELSDMLDKYWSVGNEEHIIDVFSSGISLMENFPANADIVFLDIEMPGISGIDTARMLRERYSNLCIFFVTAYTKYAIEGYSVHAFAYIKKPIKYGQLCQQLDDALTTIMREKPRTIALHRGSETILRNIQEIQIIEVNRHVLTIYGQTTQDQFPMNLNDLMPQIENHGFLQCHRSYVVNTNYIARFTATDVIMKNGVTVPVSKHRRKEFMESYTQYKGAEL